MTPQTPLPGQVDAPGTPGPSARPAGHTRRRVLLGAGIGLVTAGVAGAGFVGWELFNDPVMDPAVAEQGAADLKRTWAKPAKPAAETTIDGGALALLRIPAIAANYEVPIVYGTTPYALHRGVGWFENTARPGEIGNFALAGHRGVTGPFVKLPDLQPGAEVIVETRKSIFTYVLDNHPADLVVDKTETWVLQPVPGKPAEKPTTAMITMITCASLIFDQRPRAVAQGHLLTTVAK